MTDGAVQLSAQAADALGSTGLFGDVGEFILPEKAAWIACVLRELPDEPRLFPRGKWATIQAIEEQVQANAAAHAKTFDVAAWEAGFGT